MTTLAFPEFLDLIEDRSAALRGAAAGPADLEVRVPGCPDWSLRDLVAHLGFVQRFWAATIAAGPRDAPPNRAAIDGADPHGDLVAWSSESTDLLLAALRDAGPERGCWAWWDPASASWTAASVARHQVQEAAVHAHDAQEAVGRPEPIPTVAAVDGLSGFLDVFLGSAGPWPHRPARVSVQVSQGPRWLVDLAERGSLVVEDDGTAPAVRLEGSASDLLLFLNGRLGPDRIRVEGDRALVEALLAWPDLT
ncbi:hypothetical protein AQ490_14685 [Wenjunlia vitaminophila]|uniref:Maleylpyruvate isomerase family mycothiol-dependent enzyme n=1 Tax=Wenjunlia vitaminophila TaxID=76728 RepID=A0A0T6LW99_WENVI|nr:maleylpyruvate isomerase family mycothiol-dependent enzyme [Wenjunlia vitaminophila]KRV50342.1 hypothetical protein AQ490_14685 [Wenjunlia vitaminophila]